MRNQEKIQNSSVAIDDTVYYSENEGNNEHTSNSYGLSGEALLYLSKKDYLTIGCFFDAGESEKLIDYKTRKLIDNEIDIAHFSDMQHDEGIFTDASFFLSYRHEFDNKDQKCGLFIRNSKRKSENEESDNVMQGDTLLTSGFNIKKTGNSSMR